MRLRHSEFSEKFRVVTLLDCRMQSFWFVPALMGVLAVGLAVSRIALDFRVKNQWLDNYDWIWFGSADGARSVLLGKPNRIHPDEMTFDVISS